MTVKNENRNNWANPTLKQARILRAAYLFR